jgi:ABC-type uncharacterized transport system auxiliary subunit
MLMLNKLLANRLAIIRPLLVMLILGLVVSLLGGCAQDETDANTAITAQQHQATDPNYQVIVEGGDAMMQQWTIDAVNAYCAHHVWSKSIRHIHHPATVNPIFNQPRKTRVLVAPDNTLHIHFQLGGVLMANYSHELIITAPRHAICASSPIHYEVTMQPNGDAVIYKSNPLLVASTHS